MHPAGLRHKVYVTSTKKCNLESEIRQLQKEMSPLAGNILIKLIK